MEQVFQREEKAPKRTTFSVVEQWVCPHGNHFCIACEDCGRNDPRNATQWQNHPGVPH